MIEKMTRYDFILLKKEAEGFLDKLQSLGILDITRSSKPVDDHSAEMLAKSQKLKDAIAVLDKLDCPAVQGSGTAVYDGIVDDVFSLSRKIDELKAAEGAAKKELSSVSAWGEYDADTIHSLSEAGLTLRWYCIGRKKYDPSWESLVPLQVISDDGNCIRFVTVTPSDLPYDFPVPECPAPSAGIAEIQRQLESIRLESETCSSKLASLNRFVPQLRDRYAGGLADLDWYLAKVSGENAAEDSLTVFTGYAPSSQDISAELDGLGVFYTKADAVLEDKPPIKLKNNRFSRQFEVFTSMYGMPAYNEFDPTVFLSIFYLLFFAICMGDAGYGILLMVIGLFLKEKEGGLAKLYSLIITLGAGTFVVGLLMGTFFGVDLTGVSWIPESVRKCMITGEIAGYSAQMVLALAIGVIHICLAMITKAVWSIRKAGIKESIGTLGWTLLIVGVVTVLAVALMGLVSETAAKFIIIGIACVSALGIYIFNRPGRNPLLNIGSGLWDTYNMASGLMGDVLSYIRLYALGLSGGMLGSTFNLLAGMIKDGGVPVVNWVGFILVLAVGHALNLALSALGAFVHPLRLNFVEFFKNSGYEGNGKKYTPFVKQDTGNGQPVR